MLVVHHLNNSRSQRILWLLEELEIPYEIKKYQRGSDMLAPKELKEVHPLGKSPVITDGDVTLAESGAIIEYIIEKYGAGKATPPAAGKLDNLFFTHYAEGTLMPILVNKLVFTIIPQRVPFYIRPVANIIFGSVSKQLLEPNIETNSKFVEAHLAKTKADFFAGGDHPTSADYQMLFPLEAIKQRAPGHLGPNMKAWVDRVHARPAFKRALEKGGQYDLAS
ncbi:thioredoxin-like protein [Rickenella mellea]|uniref:glutathione transferase n=1 Tax=Rickenella mellea TaxID=50990 RepID=A0A4Y7QAE8_9AGAM|nr:thioredoxin-like protein [Rickenella mellea]